MALYYEIKRSSRSTGEEWFALAWHSGTRISLVLEMRHSCEVFRENRHFKLFKYPLQLNSQVRIATSLAEMNLSIKISQKMNVVKCTNHELYKFSCHL